MWNIGVHVIDYADSTVNVVNPLRERPDTCRNVWSHLIVVVGFGVIVSSAGRAYLHLVDAASCKEDAPSGAVLSLRGLYEPRIVVGYPMVRALPGAPGSTVVFFIDGKEVTRTSEAPYDSNLRAGASARLWPGSHVLTACAITAQGTQQRSDPIRFAAVREIDDTFSAELSPYVPHQTAIEESMETLLQQTATPGAAMSSEEELARRLVFGVYLNFGIDPALDVGNDQSEVLSSLLPRLSSPYRLQPNSLPVSMWFSPDSVFYHAIPREWPRVAVPDGYIRQVQFSTAYQGDGIGFGEVIASAVDPLRQVRSQWYDVQSTQRVYEFRMPMDWSSRLPTNKRGDSHLIFIDPVSNTYISSYKTKKNAATGGADALFAGAPHPLSGLGDTGGSIAAGFAELPLLVQPGESIDEKNDIPHAIGGAVGRTWAARVYPATARDAEMLSSVNPCTHRGFTNTGIVPYGGILQLDPDLELGKLKLSLPAYRILRAMQVYGYYVMDFGCADLDIYSAVDAKELEPYGGIWGNTAGPGVQNEIQFTLQRSRLYIVPPPIKRQ